MDSDCASWSPGSSSLSTVDAGTMGRKASAKKRVSWSEIVEVEHIKTEMKVSSTSGTTGPMLQRCAGPIPELAAVAIDIEDPGEFVCLLAAGWLEGARISQEGGVGRGGTMRFVPQKTNSKIRATECQQQYSNHRI